MIRVVDQSRNLTSLLTKIPTSTQITLARWTSIKTCYPKESSKANYIIFPELNSLRHRCMPVECIGVQFRSGHSGERIRRLYCWEPEKSIVVRVAISINSGPVLRRWGLAWDRCVHYHPGSLRLIGWALFARISVRGSIQETLTSRSDSLTNSGDRYSVRRIFLFIETLSPECLSTESLVDRIMCPITTMY